MSAWISATLLVGFHGMVGVVEISIISEDFFKN